jgi:hypothetical protein
VKLFLILLSLTVGSAAVVKTVELMNSATTLMRQATDIRTD